MSRWGIQRYDRCVRMVQECSNDECMIWPFKKTSKGYGQVTMPDGTTLYAHRIAFHATHGRWPEPCTRHTCDVPSCFNPRHLLEGTRAQNSRDMADRGRSCRGENATCVKLSATQVLEIRAAYKPWTKGNVPELAKRYGVSIGAIKDIVYRENWKHLP